MHIISVTELDSSRYPGLDDYLNLTDVALRRKLEPAGGLYLAESEKVIARSIAAGHRPRSLLTQPKFLDQAERLLANWPDTPVYVAEEELLTELTGYRMHRGVLASMHRPEPVDPGELLARASTVLVLENIVDHTNVGAAFRNAAALGADAVLVSEECADPLYRRSVRVSMGTVLQIPWARLPKWREAGELFARHGFETVALALDPQAIPIRDYAAMRAPRVALMLGTEGHGLSRAALQTADRTVIIPMQHGVDSLNVAATSAVALYALLNES